MKSVHGKPVSPGYGAGRAVLFRSGRGLSAIRRHLDPDALQSEVERFHAALEATVVSLDALKANLEHSIGKAADIFSMHSVVLRDPTFIERVERHILHDRMNAEYAVESAIDTLAARIASVEDEYLRERACDLRDLGYRLQNELTGSERLSLRHLPGETILVADELLPSDTIQLDRANVRGIVSERGGRTSHAAILAKALGIPAVSGLVGFLNSIQDGDRLLVDGVAGTVAVKPSADAERRFVSYRAAHMRSIELIGVKADRECRTLDGVRIELLANLGRVEEALDVRAQDLEGVGLLRTEVLFLDHDRPPTIEEHVAMYRQVAAELEGRPMVIRTLDLGGDKRAGFLPEHTEHNPTLGLRGLRFALREENLLRTQLAAILAVAREHTVRVLFPMVLGGEDLREAIDVLVDVASRDGSEKLPPVGAMIETPSALFALEDISKRADFLSIGSNDLTQFMLAADREAVELIDDYSLLHPAILRAVSEIVTKARAAGRSVTVCGEAAGDPGLAPILVGLGVRRLSMSPVRSGAVRHALRRLNMADASEAAQGLLHCEGLEEVRERLTESSALTPAES